MLTGSVKNVLSLPKYQDRRGLFQQAQISFGPTYVATLGTWNDLRIGTANKMTCGNVHWDLGSHLSLHIALPYLSAAQKTLLLQLRIILPLGDVSVFIKLFLHDFTFFKPWNIFLQQWKKTCKYICHWPQFRLWECGRTVPVVKSVSVKADVSFLYTSLYLHPQS